MPPALSRQERHRARGRARRSARRPGRPALPGDARPGPVPVRGRGRRRCAPSARATSTTTSARRPAPTSPPRTSAPGTAASHALGAVGRAVRRRCRPPAQREPAARRGGATPRQHGRGLQEVVRPSARAGGARHRGGQASRCARARQGRAPRRPERRPSAACSLSSVTAERLMRGLRMPRSRRRLYSFLPVGRYVFASHRQHRCEKETHPWKNRSFGQRRRRRPHAGPEPPEGAEQLHRRDARRAARGARRRGGRRGGALRRRSPAAGRGFCAGQDLADPAVAPNLEPGAQRHRRRRARSSASTSRSRCASARCRCR